MSSVAIIVDDDERSRLLLSRVLRDHGVTAVAFTDVRAVLDDLAQRASPPSVLILSLPPCTWDDVRLLTTLPALARTHFIATAVNTTAEVVLQCAGLGITDVLHKPLRPALLRDRVWNALERVRLSGTSAGEGTIALGASVLLLDGSAEYRRFFRDAAAPLFAVNTAATGAEGLSIAREQTPAAVFLGEHTGLVTAERFARRVRTDDALAGLRLFRLVSRGEVASDLELFDGALPRTAAQDILQQELARLVRR